MGKDELRQIIREEVRAVVREELEKVFGALSVEMVPSMTLSEVASSLKVSRSTVDRLVNSGKLQTIEVNNHTKVRLSDFNDYISRQYEVKEIEHKKPDVSQDLMTISQVSRATGLNRTQIYREIDKGTFETKEINGRTYLSYCEVVQFTESRKKSGN